MRICEARKAAISQFERAAGELHGHPRTTQELENWVSDWKFTLYLRYCQGELESFEYIEQLRLLEQINHRG